MESSANGATVPTRVSAVFRLLMQLRLLLVATTVLLLLDNTLTVESMLAVIFSLVLSWLAAHYARSIVQPVSRHPLLFGLDVLVSFVVLRLGGPLSPFFLFTVITAAAVGMLYHWRGVAYFCTLQVLSYYGVLALDYHADLWGNLQAIIGQPAYYPLVGFLGIRVRKLLNQQEAMETSRNTAEVAAAAAEERSRLAREMHDSLAKTLRGIAMSAKALPMWVERKPERAVHEAANLASAAEVASREARDLIADLRTDDLQQPLAESLRGTVEDWAATTGHKLRTSMTDDVTLPILARYEAIAVLKESLSNIERHADASSVEVSLRFEGGRVVLTVTDDGRGFDSSTDDEQRAQEGHYGLLGMGERAKRAEGRLEISSATAQGTSVRALFPLDADPGKPIEADVETPQPAVTASDEHPSYDRRRQWSLRRLRRESRTHAETR